MGVLNETDPDAVDKYQRNLVVGLSWDSIPIREISRRVIVVGNSRLVNRTLETREPQGIEQDRGNGVCEPDQLVYVQSIMW